MRASGFSSVELLVSLGILATTIALSVPAIRSLAITFRTLRTHDSLTNAELELANELRHSLGQAAPLPGLQTARVHPPGRFHSAAWEDLTDKLTSRATRPSPSDTPISFLAVAPEIVLRVIERSGTSSALELRLCFSGDTSDTTVSKQLSETELWLVSGVDGTFEMTGRLRTTSAGHPKCSGGRVYRGRLAHRSLSIFQLRTHSESELSENRALLHPLSMRPIVDSYSLYLDTKGTLRRISHVVSENQPRLYNIHRFDIRDTPNSSGGATLRVETTLEDSHSGVMRESELYLYRPSTQGDLLDLSL